MSQPEDATVTDVIAEVQTTREVMRDEARSLLGVTGDTTTESFRTLRKRFGLPLYPLGALGVLTIIDEFQGYAFAVLTPEISRSLGISIASISTLVAIKIFANTLGPLPIAALSQKPRRRAMLSIVTAIAWSLLTLTTGFATSLLALSVILVADGISTGSVKVLHHPLLMDSYPPSLRVRVLSAYEAFHNFGTVLSPLLVGVCAGIFDLTWRGVFVALGTVSTLMTLTTLGLRDPGFGKWDTERVRNAVHVGPEDADEIPPAAVRLGFWEVGRRLLLIPTVATLLRGTALFGVLLIPLSTFISFFLEDAFDLGPAERGVFFAYQGLIGIIALTLYGNRGERQFRKDPARVLRFSGFTAALAVTAIVGAAATDRLWVAVVSFGISSAGTAIISPALSMAALSIVPASMRAHAAGAAGIAMAVGGLGGLLFLNGINERFGLVGAMVSVVLPGVLAGLVIARAGRTVVADLDLMIDEIIEEEELRQLTASGVKPPLLDCRGVDFSYGQLQVLFGVDFKVDAGEMVALLGVNGAGKSTLLKVISGIGLPSRGSVRLNGHDITYLDAERRVNLGITQIPGGKAVFGPMTVVENLRAFAYTAPGGPARVSGLIDDCFDAFPRLAERATSRAAELSGGEQQMLALCKALILQPRLLIVDELSLGLAPVIVSQLLEMVRRINATGTAVVLVEQSVNIALNLVDHAYFMEKGEMKFDGPSKELLARGDLLRAVFLAGAGAAGPS